ncbi:hypothetical protein CVS40_11826 [Lucilia cuprina]|nr:hypothetical protein CVS40_11826 [Lucilia cuprina]
MALDKFVNCTNDLLDFEIEYTQNAAENNIHSLEVLRVELDSLWSQVKTAYEEPFCIQIMLRVDQGRNSSNIKPKQTRTDFCYFVTWPTFRDLFTALYINNSRLSKIEKLFHLIQKTGGVARKIVSNASLTNESFDIAWKNLVAQYEINEQLKILFDLPNVAEDSDSSIEKLQRTVNSCIQALNALGVETSTWDPFLVYLCSTKLPRTLLKEFENSLQETTKVPTWKQFNTFLTHNSKTLEYVAAIAQSNTKSDQHRKDNSKSSSKPKRVHTFQMNTTQNETGPKTRKSLNTNRSQKNDSNFKCQHCKESHHLWSCPKFSQIHVTTASLLITVSRTVKSTSASNRENLLLIVQIETKGLRYQARTIIDPVHVTVLRQTITETSTKAGLFNLCSKVDSQFKLEFWAPVLKTFPSNLPPQTLDLQHFYETAKLELSDPQFNQSRPVDLLIGLDLGPSIYLHGHSDALYLAELWVTTQHFLEETPKQVLRSDEDTFCENNFKSTTRRNDTGRMERMLNQKPELKKQYDQVIVEYLELGHMRKVSPLEINSNLITHSFQRLESVFKQEEFERHLHPGPILQQDLVLLILKWRFFRFVYNADITKMMLFRQTANDPIEDYELLTVTFGVNCSPFLAIKTLLQLAEDVKLLTHSRQKFFNKTSGGHTLIDAIKSRKELTTFLKSSRFDLMKWISNDHELLESNGTFLQAHLHSQHQIPNESFFGLIVDAKVIMQQIWLDKVDWDDIIKLLTCLNPNCNVEIHGFSEYNRKTQYSRFFWLQRPVTAWIHFIGKSCMWTYTKSSNSKYQDILLDRLNNSADLVKETPLLMEHFCRKSCLRNPRQDNPADPKLKLPKNHWPISTQTGDTNLEAKTIYHALIEYSRMSCDSGEIQELTEHIFAYLHSLSTLNPFMDRNGIIRANGRLAQSPELTYNERYPILLPHNSKLSRLLVEFIHKITLHGENQLMTRVLRTEYWIFRLKPLVKSVIHNFKTCVLYKKQIQNHIMASLPENTTLSRPFAITGVDYAGPFDIKNYTGRACLITKNYICIFVCFATKAVHLEAASDLSTQSFLAAFSRFIGRLGCPALIYSDNGKNFVGAAELLRKDRLYFIKTLQNHVTNHCSHQNIDWNGLWEAGVKPLSPASDEPNDLNPLSPGHFLIGSALLTQAEPDVSSENLTLINRWKRLKVIYHSFCQRWKSEYLAELHRRYKWKTQRDNVKDNDLVVIKNNNLPPNEYQMGRIIKTYLGPNQNCRVVDIKTKKGVITRPITKIVTRLLAIFMRHLHERSSYPYVQDVFKGDMNSCEYGCHICRHSHNTLLHGAEQLKGPETSDPQPTSRANPQPSRQADPQPSRQVDPRIIDLNTPFFNVNLVFIPTTSIKITAEHVNTWISTRAIVNRSSTISKISKSFVQKYKIIKTTIKNGHDFAIFEIKSYNDRNKWTTKITALITDELPRKPYTGPILADPTADFPDGALSTEVGQVVVEKSALGYLFSRPIQNLIYPKRGRKQHSSLEYFGSNFDSLMVTSQNGVTKKRTFLPSNLLSGPIKGSNSSTINPSKTDGFSAVGNYNRNNDISFCAYHLVRTIIYEDFCDNGLPFADFSPQLARKNSSNASLTKRQFEHMPWKNSDSNQFEKLQRSVNSCIQCIKCFRCKTMHMGPFLVYLGPTEAPSDLLRTHNSKTLEYVAATAHIKYTKFRTSTKTSSHFQMTRPKRNRRKLEIAQPQQVTVQKNDSNFKIPLQASKRFIHIFTPIDPQESNILTISPNEREKNLLLISTDRKRLKYQARYNQSTLSYVKQYRDLKPKLVYFNLCSKVTHSYLELWATVPEDHSNLILPPLNFRLATFLLNLAKCLDSWPLTPINDLAELDPKTGFEVRVSVHILRKQLSMSTNIEENDTWRYIFLPEWKRMAYQTRTQENNTTNLGHNEKKSLPGNQDRHLIKQQEEFEIDICIQDPYLNRLSASDTENGDSHTVIDPTKPNIIKDVIFGYELLTVTSWSSTASPSAIKT